MIGNARTAHVVVQDVDPPVSRHANVDHLRNGGRICYVGGVRDACAPFFFDETTGLLGGL